MPWTKEQYCQDLYKFAELICHYDDDGCICNGIGVLFSIENQYRHSGSTKLVINGVMLTVRKKIAGTRPAEVQSLNIYIDCLCDVDLSRNANEKDLIKEYDLQLVIIGDAGGKEYLTCWHLDKDIPPEDGDIHNHTHPSYHFQAGGDGLEGKDTGQLLLVTAPRLPHPPMDIFLAIHFVINNFFGKSDFPFVERLFRDKDYQDILDRAKKRMFDPYFQAFKEGCIHQDFNIGKVFPLAV